MPQQHLPFYQSFFSSHRHQLSLSKVNGLNPDFHVPARQVIEKQLGFLPGYIWHTAAFAPMVHQCPAFVYHGSIPEMPLLNGKPERLEYPGWDRNILHFFRYNLKNACLEYHGAIECMK